MGDEERRTEGLSGGGGESESESEDVDSGEEAIRISRQSIVITNAVNVDDRGFKSTGHVR
jgi:hypothetical protein